MGSCAKCGRPLTDAKSIELGIGPKCRSYWAFDRITNAYLRVGIFFVHTFILNHC
jgi:hypothetical protein